MEKRSIIRRQAVVEQILAILSDRIKDCNYPPNSKLPSENALSEEFDVSRVTIRRAMDILVSRGKIFRMQGVGSFVSGIAQIANPIVDPVLFQDLIRNQGYKPGIQFIHAQKVALTDQWMDKLKIGPHEEIVELQKVFTADGEPVIFCSNLIPRWVLKGSLFERVLRRPSITEPIFDFLDHECGEPLAFYISTLRLDSMGNCAIKLKEFSPATPALVIDETGYNNQERPIMQSIHFYPGNHMKFELIRRRSNI
ncbi:MAG TPA: GntR family transcriptional regulator [Anaerolineales bacterium]|nr:GntR family transcriptional regulator [Anaerolineales bacterium]